MHGRISFLRDTKYVGDVSEARVIAACVEAGFHVLVPFGENQRFDIAIEKNGVFSRVQIKTGRLRNGVIRFNGYSVHKNRGQHVQTRTYEGEVEFFGVYCPALGRTFLIPASDVGTGLHLRVERPRNCQIQGIRWADDYELAATSATKSVGVMADLGVPLGVGPL